MMTTRRLWRLGLPVPLQKTEDMGSGPYATGTAIIHGFLWSQSDLPASQTSQFLNIYSR